MPAAFVIFRLLQCCLLALTLPWASSAQDLPEGCPINVSTPEQLGAALGCRDGACSVCGEVQLVGDDGLSNSVPSGTTVQISRNLTVRGKGRKIIWDMGHKKGVLKLDPGVHLSLVEITLVSGLKKNSEADFLVPNALSGIEAQRLELVDVRFVTTRSQLEECVAFAEAELPPRAFQIEEVRGLCGQILRVDRWSSDAVEVSNVSISCWEIPVLGDGNVLRITHSKQLQQVLENWDDLLGIDEMEIINDIIFDPKDWPKKGITLNRNLTLKGTAANRSLMDFRLMSAAIVVSPPSTVKLENFEIINLALGTKKLPFAALLWFFRFKRLDLGDPGYHDGLLVENSTLVVSCEEFEHYEYIVALLTDPLLEVLSDNKNVTKAITQWNFLQEAENMTQVDNGTEYGVSFSDVNFTCKANRGELLEQETTEVLSPLRIQPAPPFVAPAPNPSVPPPDEAARTTSVEPGSGSTNEDADLEEDSEGGPETSTMFTILLALLVPMCLLLFGICYWKFRTRGVKKDIIDEENGSPLKIIDDMDGKTNGQGSLMPKKGTRSPKFDSQKNLKSPTNSEDFQDPLPVPVNGYNEKKTQPANVQLPRLEMAKSHCAEFIPDILAVSEDIDDKQLVLNELLGEGMHGTVHKGVWRELDVAVKTIVFRGHGESHQDWQQRAIREVAITSGLSHQNVVCTYSYDIKRLHTGAAEAKLESDSKREGLKIWDACVDWKLYIIQEYCDGGSLKETLKMRALTDKKAGGPDLESLLELASGIARGVHHIHSKNIIHGDLKPSNVLLKKDDDLHAKVLAKIADFGLSLKMQESQTHVSNVQHGATGYTAPEVVEQGNCSKAADVYAFGVVLWDLYMTQISPIGVATPEMKAHFPRLPLSCPALYGALAVACMHHDPSSRPSFSEILELLCHIWQQLRMGTLVPPALPPMLRLQQKAREIAVSCRCVDSASGQRLFDNDEHEDIMERRRTYYAKALAGVPQLFRNIEFEEVYWPDITSDSSMGQKWK